MLGSVPSADNSGLPALIDAKVNGAKYLPYDNNSVSTTPLEISE